MPVVFLGGIIASDSRGLARVVGKTSSGKSRIVPRLEGGASVIRHQRTKCAGCLVFIAFAIVSCESADTQAPATRPASGPGGSQAGLRLSATSSPSTLPTEAYVERLIVQLGSYSRETQEKAVKDLK